MALPHAKSGDLVQLLPAPASVGNLSTTLIRDDHIEVFLLAMQRGEQMQEHRAAGAMTLQCLSGEIQLHCHGNSQTLSPGSLIYLQDAEPHAIDCTQAALLLITLILHRK